MDHPGGIFRIVLDSAFTGKWDRYFIYKDLNIIKRFQTSTLALVYGSGILIDNYGQSYKFALGNRHYTSYDQRYQYGYLELSPIEVYNPEIKILPDYDNYQKLTNHQIDYIKENGKFFEYVKDPFTKKTLGKLCDDESKKDTEIAELQTQLSRRDEEIAHLRDLLLESARRGIREREERNALRAIAAAATRNRNRAAPAPVNKGNNDPTAPNARRRRNTRRRRA